MTGHDRTRPTADPSTGLVTRAAAAFTAYRLGEQALMDAFVEELTPLLWRVARSCGLDTAAAEDVVQTTWVALVENADAVDNPHAILKWLVTTARREAWRVARLRQRDQVMDDRDLDLADQTMAAPMTTMDPALTVAASDADERLWRHVASLPERCRHLLQVIAFAQRPDYAAIGEALGMPVGSIGPTRGRCLAKLRVLLTSDPAWEG